jgi:CheY-like chemotaxis protein
VAPLLAGIGVLVVDDAPDSLEVLTYLVGQEGGTVRGAANARDALEILLEWTPQILLLDISMPDMNGYELLTTIRGMARLSEIPAVAVTAHAFAAEHAFAADQQKSLEAGFAAHVSKPYDADALMALVAALAPKSG